MASASDTASAGASAAHQVLLLPELLEQIPLHASPLDVLRGSAVCSTVKEIIDTSTKLQQKLFLRPNDSIPEHQRTPNPPLQHSQEHRHGAILSLTTPDYTLVEGNFPVGEYPMSGVPGEPGEVLISLSSIPKPGSCASMFLTQPPVTVVRLYTHCYDGERPQTRRAFIVRQPARPAGLTYGDVCWALMADDPPILADKRIEDVAKMREDTTYFTGRQASSIEIWDRHRRRHWEPKHQS